MDGTVKTVVQDFFEDGGMIRSQLTVDSLPLEDEEAEGRQEEDQATEAEDLEEDISAVHEENLEEEEPEVKKEETPVKEDKMQFGDYLDLMEVF